jgi:putative transposase
MNERVTFVDEYRHEHGVEPICRALEDTPAQIAPSTYYAARARPPSDRDVRDEYLTERIRTIHADNYGVYGVRKIRAALRREGERVAESTVRRLMRAEGLRGISRRKGPRTTKPAAETGRPLDLVNREFVASRPNELWVADITYVHTFSGWVYVAFVTDVFSRLVVGWQVSTRLYTDLALDALQMGIWRRQHAGDDLTGLVHHSDRGVQYRAIRYADRLADCDAVASVGSKGDSLLTGYSILDPLRRHAERGEVRDVLGLRVQHVSHDGQGSPAARAACRRVGARRGVCRPVRAGGRVSRASAGSELFASDGALVRV